jgi:cyclic pyranopterin phosphate synthase
VRITGGEPLVRKEALKLCRAIAGIEGLESLTMTTNGVLLCDFAKELFQAGIRRVNISLDTLKPERFLQITRRDLFKRVWAGIMAAQQAGFSTVKINTVVMAGINDDEIEDLARLTFRSALHVRFIEYMPFKEDAYQARFFPAARILDRLRPLGRLEEVSAGEADGPAKHYSFKGALGKIGVIGAVSNHFCSRCNRLRLTADGKLKTCLFSADETDLRLLLRTGAKDSDITDAIVSAVQKKPERHHLGDPVFRKCIARPMFSIGG